VVKTNNSQGIELGRISKLPKDIDFFIILTMKCTCYLNYVNILKHKTIQQKKENNRKSREDKLTSSLHNNSQYNTRVGSTI
jgi:hypothetical protein